MQNGIDHVLLTRFNLPSEGAESSFRRREGWLHSRVDLFERYCLPSVEKQTVNSFQWIIYFDPETPMWLKSRVKELARSSLFTPIFRARVNRQELLSDLRDLTGSKNERLLTTNLDNDDGLSSDFVARLQLVPWEGERTAIYMVRGLIRSGSELYLRTDRANAFCSVIEEWDSAQTCWSDWHNLLGQSMKVSRIGGDPAWLQVIHDANVSNRVHGKRTSAEPYLSDFGPLLDGVDNPAPLTIAKDFLVDLPIRYTRDLARKALKQGAIALVGKDGLDHIKSALASSRLKQDRISK
ncbi:glycosyltransferase [Pseudarthrobacter sp. NPDC058119]|uniref:glycosyltransferase n=1 Tax=Pseudarthrobacter sp. NPDC058119 TaxID=3346348 RepID=UPI0036DDAF8D